MQVTFPWPLKELSPNARLHWSKVAKAKKAYRKVCWALALEAGLAGKFDQAQRLSVHMVFYPPDRRERDEDNLVASMKSASMDWPTRLASTTANSNQPRT